MKYLVTWKQRPGGSGAEHEAAVKRGLALFSKWSPPAGATFHQFLNRLDGEGGFAVVETDDPMLVAEGPAKFGTLFEFCVTPVADITEMIPIISEGAAFRDSVS